MSSLNNVILIGRLGGDVETSTIAGTDRLVGRFSLATSEQWKNKQTGEREEKTQWHKVVVFGKTAEIAKRYLQKGDQCCIEGSVEYRSYEKDGETKWVTDIVGRRLTMLGSARQRTAPDHGRDNQPAPAQAAGAYDNFDDDIPF